MTAPFAEIIFGLLGLKEPKLGHGGLKHNKLLSVLPESRKFDSNHLIILIIHQINFKPKIDAVLKRSEVEEPLMQKNIDPNTTFICLNCKY